MRHTNRPTLDEELALHRQGYRLIAGIDEAGRGAMAGPVVAAAVVLPIGDGPDILQQRLDGLRDSKLMTPTQRDRLYSGIYRWALAVGVGIVSSTIIDTVGIAKAAGLAMRGAVTRLGHGPDYLLIDAFELARCSIPQHGIIRGDRTCLSIAAASVIAKVTRDRIMTVWDALYPEYGLARHKGYVTRDHKLALHRYGPCPIHRLSYAPVRIESARCRTLGWVKVPVHTSDWHGSASRSA